MSQDDEQRRQYARIFDATAQITRDVQKNEGPQNHRTVGIMAAELQREGLITDEVFLKLLEIDRASSNGHVSPELIEQLPSEIMTPVKAILKRDNISYRI